jgi:single-strand DNA-binding protein
MASFNKVILIGNLVADPEIKQTQSGISVCRFNIAVNRRYARAQQGEQNGQGAQQTADFITIVAWRQHAEFVARYFKKGRPILVCGQLQSRSWTDQQNVRHYATEVVADDVTFVDSKSDAPAAGGNNTQYVPDAYGAPAYTAGGSTSFEEIPDDGNLPF